MKNPNSNQAKVRALFEAAPFEMLMFDDIALKTGMTRGQAQSAVQHLRAAGVLATRMMVMKPDVAGVDDEA